MEGSDDFFLRRPLLLLVCGSPKVLLSGLSLRTSRWAFPTGALKVSYGLSVQFHECGSPPRTVFPNCYNLMELRKNKYFWPPGPGDKVACTLWTVPTHHFSKATGEFRWWGTSVPLWFRERALGPGQTFTFTDAGEECWVWDTPILSEALYACTHMPLARENVRMVLVRAFIPKESLNWLLPLGEVP